MVRNDAICSNDLIGKGGRSRISNKFRIQISGQHKLCWSSHENQGIWTHAFQCFISFKVTSAAKRWLLKMCHLRHRLRIFLFHRKVMFRSEDIQVFVFLTMHWFINGCHDEHVMMSISTWDRVHFWIYLVNHNSLTYQTW